MPRLTSTFQITIVITLLCSPSADAQQQLPTISGQVVADGDTLIMLDGLKKQYKIR
ncbi:MAG: hypothetical protein H0W76_11530 [Pyrinomonadaceae bacterium]|nr:hypothetical protein [Pyrinomonadaceae bacterium]